LSEELVTKDSEVVALKIKIEELTQALTDLKGMNEMFLNTAREKERDLTNVKKSLSLYESKSAEHDSIKSSLELNISKLTKENVDLKNQVQNITTQGSSHTKQIGSLEAELEKKMETELSLVAEISKIQAELSSKMETEVSLGRKIATLEADLASKLAKEKELLEEIENCRNKNQDEESPIVEILNEKSKELSEARHQLQQLTECLQIEKDKVVDLQNNQSEMRTSYSEMQEEGMKRLTCMVRDKELELTGLQQRNVSLIQVLEQEKSKIEQLEENNLHLKSECDRLHTEITNQANSNTTLNETSCDNQTMITLKDTIKHLELKLEESSRASQSGSEELHNTIKDLKNKLTQAEAEITKLKANADSKLTEKNEEFTAEVDRIRNDMKTLAADRNSLETRLKGKEKEVTDLHKEVRSLIEKKKWVEGELERLRNHLVGIEESYTQELVLAEEREADLRTKLGKLEDQVKRASMSHSEASQEASEAATHLTEALTAAATARDTLSEQLKVSEAKLREKSISLRNLQFALEGFQKQKENEIRLAERKCQNLIEIEQNKCSDLQEQLTLAKKQLSAANEGLEAASRMSQQLELKQHHIAALKHEISTLEELLKEANEKLKNVSSSQVGRVDRELVKNLILGYVTADTNKKTEILRIIATVLDFNQDDRGRTGLDGESRGWLGGLLASRAGRPNSDQINQSIAQAFVKFLEEESVPQQTVQLPVLEMARRQQEQLMSGNTPRSTPSPLLLNSLPTFSPTSTILKSVLDEKDENKN